MLSDSENVELGQAGHVELKESVDVGKFLSGQSFEINYDNVQQNDENNIPCDEDIEDFLQAFPDLSLNEDEDIRTTSFEVLAQKMENVTEDSQIKKQIKRPGIHGTPPDDAMVSIIYCSYLEYNDEPLDYAHIKNPYNFQLGTAGIVGLNFAVKSMRVNELAYFLIGPDYVFGSMGHPPRVPPNSTFLFRIELIRFSETIQSEKLSREDKNKFPYAFNTALRLMESAKEKINKNIKLAIRDYRRALYLIEEANLADFDEQKEQLKLKLRLLTNLAICYNKDGCPKRACIMCNDIYAMVKTTPLKIPAKVYFNNGRALYMIGEYQRAKNYLEKARNIEPHNPIIAEELNKINVKIGEEKIAQINIAELPNEEIRVDEDFKQLVVGLCESLIQGDDRLYTLPAGLSEIERKFAQEEAEKVGLKLVSNSMNNNLVYYITKK